MHGRKCTEEDAPAESRAKPASRSSWAPLRQVARKRNHSLEFKSGLKNIVKHLHCSKAELFSSKYQKSFRTVNICRSFYSFPVATQVVPESCWLKNSRGSAGTEAPSLPGRGEGGREWGTQLLFQSIRGPSSERGITVNKSANLW